MRPARTMKGDRAIDAITMLRTDPGPYLVVPRVLALVIMARCNACSFFCGRGVSGPAEQHLPVLDPANVFWKLRAPPGSQPSDLPLDCWSKSVVFGCRSL